MASFALGTSPLEVIKTAELGGASAGDVVTFTMTVKNTGIETLSEVAIGRDVLERGDGTPLTLTTGPTFVSNSGGSAAGTLVPGETATFRATYTLVQQDVDAGRISNQAVGVGTSPTIGVVSAYSQSSAEADQSPTVVDIPRTSGISLEKDGEYEDANGNELLDVGDRVRFTFSVKNEGNIQLSNVNVTDSMGAVTGGPLASLGPGVTDSTTFVLLYNITQADIDKGEISNSARVSATATDGTPVSDTAETTLGFDGSQAICLKKMGGLVDANGNGVADVGEHIAYTFEVENSGDVTLSNITVSDPRATGGVNGGTLATLGPRQVDKTTFSARYVLTQADIDAGAIENTATVTGTAPDGGEVSDQSTVTVREEGVSALFLEKSGEYVDHNSNGRVDPGDRINYKFTVRNDGSLTLSNITISDSLTSVSGGPLASLPVGNEDSTTFSAFYTLTQADIDKGEVFNEATARGADPRGNAVSDDSEATVVLNTSESISLDKTATFVDVNANDRADAGDRIDYSFRIENTGDVTLTDVSLSDPKVGVVGGPLTSLSPSASDTTTFSARYTITQADIDAGEVINSAKVSADAPDGDEVDDTGMAEVELRRNPGIKLVKDAIYEDVNNNSIHDPGDRLNYTFTVENTGNVTLSNIRLTDPKVSVIGGPIATLAPGATDRLTFRAQYEIQQSDVDLGYVVNQADVVAADPEGNDVKGRDGHRFSFTQSPAFTFEKSGTYADTNGNSRIDVGDHINYTFTVVNTGNVTLSDTAISDPKVTVNGGEIETISPGGRVERSSAPYAITQADIDAGQVENTATVETSSENHPELTATASSVVPLERAASIKLEKFEDGHTDTNGNGVVDAGDVMAFRFEIENDGNVTLANVQLSDPVASVSGGPVPSLSPGAKDSAAFTARYTLTQADLDAGKVSNTAEVSATAPGGQTVSDDSTVELLLTAAPAVLFVKTGEIVDTNGSGRSDLGDEIVYRFLVRNTGNVTLRNLRVADDLVEVTGGPLDTLAPAATDSDTFHAKYKITQADIEAGQVENTAKLTAETPSGQPLEMDSQNEAGVGPTVVAIEVIPEIGLSLEGVLIDANGNGFPDAGERIEYDFVVSNTGNVALSNVSLPSMELRSPDGATVSIPVSGGPLASLAVGGEDRATFSASHVLTQEQIDQRSILAIAQVHGFSPAGDEVTSQAQHQTELPQNASLLLVKTGELDTGGNADVSPGDGIDYEFVATNDGNVLLEGVVPNDPGPLFRGKKGTGSLSGFTPESASVEPGESVTFRARYFLSQADINRALNVLDSIKNTATVSGRAPNGEVAVSSEAEATVNLPGVLVSKTTEFPEVQRGDIVPYTLLVYELGAGDREAAVNLVDYLPKGFAYVPDSARVAGVSATPSLKGRRLVMENLHLSPDAPVEITLDLLVTAAAVPGEYVNSAWVESLDGERISPVATASVDVVPEFVFDCSDVVGKVFDDKNRNGYQDDGEGGIPGARVASVDGLIVTSDEDGRFSVACADLPDHWIGTNFSLKLDPRSLPTGYRITTENPRVIRLTSGKVSKANFGVSIGRVVRLDIDGRAFEDNAEALRPKWQLGVVQLMSLLEQEPTVLRLVYVETGEGRRLAGRRIAALKNEIDARWRQQGGRYELLIETVRK